VGFAPRDEINQAKVVLTPYTLRSRC